MDLVEDDATGLDEVEEEDVDDVEVEANDFDDEPFTTLVGLVDDDEEAGRVVDFVSGTSLGTLSVTPVFV